MSLKSTIQTNVKGSALTLAANTFPGPIQDAIQLYLNGITIPLGNGDSLTVTNNGATLNMSPVTVAGTDDNVTVTITGTGSYDGASIVATFTEGDDDKVTISIDAEMGDTLTWKVSELWPGLSILQDDPFKNLSLAQGSLKLSYDSNTKEIDFLGSGHINYKPSGQDAVDFANGAVKIIYTGTEDDPNSSNIGVLLGAVVTSWSPGTIWSPLKDITFKDTGIVFSNIDGETPLSDLNLLPANDVPSIVTGDYKVAKGICCFTTLTLSNLLKPLQNIIGQDQTLALFASKGAGEDGELDIKAVFGASAFKPNNNSIFEFKGFTLDWTMEKDSYTISADATGTFQPGDESLDLTLGGSISGGDSEEIKLKIEIDDWDHPFGLSKLNIKQLEADVSLSSNGVTMGLEGAFQFTTPENTFAFDVGGEITDFEAPTGIAFVLQEQSPGKQLTIGGMIDGITDLNVSANPVFEAIDDIIQITDIAFGVVESDPITFNYPKKITFDKGFTLKADFELFHQENINIDVEISKDKFTANASMEEAVKYGDYITLARSNGSSDGPTINISSHGETITGINNNQPVYFYGQGYISLFDFVELSVYGLATTDGTVKFVEQMTGGARGVHFGEQFYIALNSKKLIFDAGFSFDFGFTNETIPSLSLFGVTLTPEITLPNLDVGAGLGVSMNGEELSFALKGALDFDFMGVHLNYGTWQDMKQIFSVTLQPDLSGGPTSKDGVMGYIWDIIKEELENLLQDVVKGLEDFLSFAKNLLKAFGSALVNFADAVATVLKNEFNKLAKDVARMLSFVGCAVDDIAHALVHVMEQTAEEAAKLAGEAWHAVKSCAAETATATL